MMRTYRNWRTLLYHPDPHRSDPRTYINREAAYRENVYGAEYRPIRRQYSHAATLAISIVDYEGEADPPPPPNLDSRLPGYASL